MLTRMRTSKGFTLIELMIVVAIIGILAAVAIPGYIGFQNKSRRGAMERASEAAKYELQGWITSARSGTIDPLGKGLLIEVDSNYDGVVDATDDTNAVLAGAGGVGNGVAGTYCTARTNGNGVNGIERSPFAGVNPVAAAQVLWVNGAAAPGIINLNDGAAGGGINRVTITATDNLAGPILRSVVTSD